MADSLKIYSWNVNGIRSVLKKGDLQKFIDVYQPDIFCLQETKAQVDQVEHVFDGYHEYWHSAEKKGYSGTAIFSKIEPVSVSKGFPESLISGKDMIDSEGRDFSREGRIITAEYDSFYLVTVYTPNAKDDLSRLSVRYDVWDKLFLEYMQLLEQSKPVIFCGDLNVAHTEIDLARPNQNKGKKGFTDEERERFQDYIDAGFFDTFRKFHPEPDNYTWWTHWANARARNVGWRIDYFLASSSLDDKIVDAFILNEVMGSDHCPVGIEIVL